MKINKLYIGQRLALGFGVVIALLLVMAGVAYTGLNALNDEIKLAGMDRYPKTVLVHTVKDELNEVARNMRNVLLMTDPAELKKQFENMDESSALVSAALGKLDKSITSERGRRDIAALKVVRERFLALRVQFVTLAKDGQLDQAKALLYGEVRPAQIKYFEVLDELIAYQDGLMTQAAADAQALASRTCLMILALALAAGLASVLIAVLATRSITRPLRRAVDVARQVAGGDLTSVIEVSSSDETGQLLHALKDMNASLFNVVSQVRVGTDTIAAASSEIAGGNLDLSARTEQQAGALEETASSMEQMNATVRQNADHARQANGLAASASDVARRGGQVVSQVVQTMASIDASSRKIVDIIGVIDGIAFQTNILALNAAVEATRAGEQGRGFAVVASEVRNLAQRSAGAAKEIKGLIDDSVGQVEIGTNLVRQAGSTMDEVVASVQRVTDIMGDISLASREQETGIAQINQAITEMDGVTQQNAALVEEAAAAASSLQDQASSLAQVVSVFKLDQRFDAAPSALNMAGPRLAGPRLAAPRPVALRRALLARVAA